MCRWICLLTLTMLLMLFSASQADSLAVPCPCLNNFTSRKIRIIKECFEQQPRPNCGHAFVIKNKRGQWCIKPDVAWLQEKIQTGKLRCPSDLTF